MGLIIASSVITFVICMIHDFPPVSQIGNPNYDVYMDLVYIKPWCRFGPYGVGGLLGMMYFEYS